jgi:molybdate transport system substrate-binding protein
MRTRTALSSLVLAAATLLLATRIGARGFRKATPAPSRQVTVAAAADLKFALDDLVAAFRLGHPEISVTVSYGSSGNFFAQLSEHAPFDIFFSADAEYPRKLARQGNALKGSLFLYAVGRLVARQGGELVSYSFLVELGFLHGAKRLGPSKVHALLTY